MRGNRVTKSEQHALVEENEDLLDLLTDLCECIAVDQLPRELQERIEEFIEPDDSDEDIVEIIPER